MPATAERMAELRLMRKFPNKKVKELTKIEKETKQ